MKIDELIAKLQVLRDAHGNVQVCHDLDCGDDVIRVTQVSYNATADKSLNLPGNCVILL